MNCDSSYMIYAWSADNADCSASGPEVYLFAFVVGIGCQVCSQSSAQNHPSGLRTETTAAGTFCGYSTSAGQLFQLQMVLSGAGVTGQMTAVGTACYRQINQSEAEYPIFFLFWECWVLSPSYPTFANTSSDLREKFDVVPCRLFCN